MALNTDLTKYSVDLSAASTMVDKAMFQLQTYPQVFSPAVTVERMAALVAELNAIARYFSSAGSLVSAIAAIKAV